MEHQPLSQRCHVKKVKITSRLLLGILVLNRKHYVDKRIIASNLAQKLIISWIWVLNI